MHAISKYTILTDTASLFHIESGGIIRKYTIYLFIGICAHINYIFSVLIYANATRWIKIPYFTLTNTIVTIPKYGTCNAGSTCYS